jgi:hypothetical protein
MTDTTRGQDIQATKQARDKAEEVWKMLEGLTLGEITDVSKLLMNFCIYRLRA